MNKVLNIKKLWEKRNLTVIGRITVVKSLLVPCFNYYIKSLPLPTAEFIDKVNAMLFRFVWNDKPDRISRRQLIQDSGDGGLKMIDFCKHCLALKISTFGRILKSVSSDFSFCYLHMFGISIDSFHSHGDFYLKLTSLKISNPFWKNLLETT